MCRANGRVSLTAVPLSTVHGSAKTVAVKVSLTWSFVANSGGSALALDTLAGNAAAKASANMRLNLIARTLIIFTHRKAEWWPMRRNRQRNGAGCAFLLQARAKTQNRVVPTVVAILVICIKHERRTASICPMLP